MGIAVLGPLTWDGSASLSPRDRVVLAVLATRPGHPVAPDRIVDALWGDTPPATAGKVLQGCIARLRKGMGKEAIETSTQGYALTLPADEIDSMQFELLVTRGRELLTLGEVDRAGYLLTQALALWRGEAFADVESWPPAADEAQRLGELRLEAEELRVDAHLRAGRHEEVLAAGPGPGAGGPAAGTPLDAPRAGPVPVGRPGRGAAHHPPAQVRARPTAGHRPQPRGHGPRAGDPAPGPLAAELPGTGAIGGDTAPGRDSSPTARATPTGSSAARHDVDACLEILRRTSLLVLVGPSGCGKSSLLHAGVAATLRGRDRATVSITPG